MPQSHGLLDAVTRTRMRAAERAEQRRQQAWRVFFWMALFVSSALAWLVVARIWLWVMHWLRP